MQRTSSVLLFLLIVTIAFLVSAQDTPRQITIQQLMDQTIAERIQKYRNTREKKCTDRILKEAGQRADSIIIARAKALNVLQDTIERPLAPDRPLRPELLNPIDSSAATPLLLEDSLLVPLDSTLKIDG